MQNARVHHTMESIIELQRQEHEEIERYEQALADILNKHTTGVSRSCVLGSSMLALTLNLFLICACSVGES